MDVEIAKIETIDDNNIVAYINTMDIVKGYPITIPIAALDTRKAIYDVGHDSDALETIVREHAIHLHPFVHDLDIDPAPDPTCEWLDWKKENPKPEPLKRKSKKAVDQFGGLHDDITVSYSEEAKTQRNKILFKFKNRPGLSKDERLKLRALALKEIPK